MAKILVVEDDLPLRENISEQLELSNYEVKTAPDGIRAFELLPSFRPNLILCDVMMPNMDGIAFIRATNRHALYRSIPVIFITARVAQQDKLLGLEEGAVDYLFKPFLQKELLLKVNNITRGQTELVLHQLEQAATHQETEIQFVKRFSKLLEQHARNPSLTADKLSLEMNMSLSAMQRNLKKYLRRNFSELLKDYRLRKATAFLLETDYSLQQIADRCGFGSLSYFSFSFKQANGVSPLRFRQQHRSKTALPNE
ncbi:response regulator transcription factor [Spirosoma agri]